METDPAYPQQEESSGLFVSYDEETSTITFEWDPETHPHYNQLKNLSQEEMSQLLLDGLEDAIEELEKETQQQKEQSNAK